MEFWEKSLLVGNTVSVWLTLAIGATVALKEKAMEALSLEPEYHCTADKLVSIIVPTLQEENYLPNLLTSIKHQSYFPIETIVVDSSPLESYNATKTICSSFGARILHRPDLNVPAARNEGARQSRGEILLFSDADNILDRHCVELLVYYLLQGYVAVHPSESIYDDGIYAVMVTITRDWLKPNYWTDRCVAIWREAFFEVGGYREDFDPNLGYREDLQLGADVISLFGEDKVRKVSEAVILSSARREKATGIFSGWVTRGVRNGQLI
jgi:glycosyltransferase involved in cell wall biosynthesis